MKNLLVIDPSANPSVPASARSLVGTDDPVLTACEALASHYFVYLLRPHASAQVEDTEAGVRILPYDLGHLPDLGLLEAVVALDCPDLLRQLQRRYPEARIEHRSLAKPVSSAPPAVAQPPAWLLELAPAAGPAPNVALAS